MITSKLYDLAMRYWQAEANKDLSGVLEFFAEDAQFVSPAMDLKGKTEIARFYQKMIEDYDEIAVRPTNTVEQASYLTIEFIVRLVRKTGAVSEARGCNVFRFADNHIISLHSYFNPADF